jgi:hypothetical protein
VLLHDNPLEKHVFSSLPLQGSPTSGSLLPCGCKCDGVFNQCIEVDPCWCRVMWAWKKTRGGNRTHGIYLLFTGNPGFKATWTYSSRPKSTLINFQVTSSQTCDSTWLDLESDLLANFRDSSQVLQQHYPGHVGVDGALTGASEMSGNQCLKVLDSGGHWSRPEWQGSITLEPNTASRKCMVSFWRATVAVPYHPIKP